LRSLLPALLAVLAFAHSTPSWSAQCTPSFPYRQGWLGADVAYSIALDAHHSVWLFGDTFYGDQIRSTRRGAQMVANSIAVSTCEDGNFDIQYYLPTQRSGARRAFFDSGTAAYRYWPMDGFVYQGSLYLALYEVATKPEGRSFDFDLRGVALARVVNPHDDPRHWSVSYTGWRPMGWSSPALPQPSRHRGSTCSRCSRMTLIPRIR
jgi:hypothetical protein